MNQPTRLPELKEIVGALLFASKHPVTVKELHRVLAEVARQEEGAARDFAGVTEEDLRSAVGAVAEGLRSAGSGLTVMEVAHGYRLVNDAVCAPWIRCYLERGKQARLSRPALETLAIIAYRQPCVRSEIEQVRGVQVDQVLRNLLELQLVRIVGRSDLPGRPLLYGTTQTFLEYFGIKSLDELPGVDELRRVRKETGGVAAGAGDAEKEAGGAADERAEEQEQAD